MPTTSKYTAFIESEIKPKPKRKWEDYLVDTTTQDNPTNDSLDFQASKTLRTKIKKLKDLGVQNPIICKELNISNGQLYSHLYHLGYPIKSKVLDRIKSLGQEQIDEIVYAYTNNKYSNEDIYNLYDINKNTLYTLLDIIGVRKTND